MKRLLKIQGVGASPGIAMGKALVLKEQCFGLEGYVKQSHKQEQQIFLDALKAVIQKTEELKQYALMQIGEEEGRVFDAHLLMLEDTELLEPIHEAIKNGMSAPKAVMQEFNAIELLFEGLEDEYMRARAADLRDIRKRLLCAMLDLKETNLECLPHPVILIAHDLTPSDTARMDKNNVLGMVTELGGRTSHTAIMANALGIPCITGAKEVTQKIQEGQCLVMDGRTGVLEVEPDESRQAYYHQLMQKEAAEKERLALWVQKKTSTRDKKQVVLMANVGTPEEAQQAFLMGAEGIGLFRSEFLYMDRKNLPDEQMQLEAYKSALSGERSVIIRTLDVGGDKTIQAIPMEPEDNPFLGQRAIRLCFRHEELFLTQIRALLRASYYGNLSIMFPMISGLEELMRAKEYVERAKKELEQEGAFYRMPKIGIMIEVPSAAVMADVLAMHCDFMSIGTNDLIQYTMAAARENLNVAYLYSPFQPAVLRLIQATIKAAKKAKIPCKMCGEMAGDTRMVPLLLGMGLEEFSMNAPNIVRVRCQIAQLNQCECETLAKEVLRMQSAKEIEAYMNKVERS